ncbi:hypothetical protein ACTD5D_16575 [Nocardia takedensis]|uniref:hypothetical protein n=1 Tax=Nocardia takedensis TaxID=259390 RepID=UPI003F75B78C
MRIRTLSVLASTTVACTGLLAPTALADARVESVEPLCVRAQVQTANLRVAEFDARGGAPTERTYTDPADFAESKPEVRPLTVSGYTTAVDGQPKQVRCKGASADRLTREYGPDIAGPEADCATVTRTTLDLVARTLTETQRATSPYPPDRIVVDPDTPVLSGPAWLAEFPVATVDAEGVLHLPSKSLFVPASVPLVPDEFKGTHYCTLIAPEYLEAVLRGTVTP